MKLVSLNCNHCGAPLQVADDARFVTCQFCETQLTVEHTGTAYFTRELEELSDKTEELADEVHRLRSDAELEKLKRNWERRRDELMMSTEEGNRFVPTKTKAILTGFLICGVAIFFMIMAGGFAGPRGSGMGVLVGALMLIVGGASAVHMFLKAETYEREKARYDRRRRELLDRDL